LNRSLRADANNGHRRCGCQDCACQTPDRPIRRIARWKLTPWPPAACPSAQIGAHPAARPEFSQPICRSELRPHLVLAGHRPTRPLGQPAMTMRSRRGPGP
jgi:hypothetical protein